MRCANYNKIQLKNKRSYNLVTKALFASLLATPLYAIAEDENKDSEIEVLTVTAQKRSQSILDVPVTVSAVGEKTIEDSKSIGLSDIDKFIPGFKFNDDNATQSVVEIRGISSPNISAGGDPSSATFYDDVYMPSAAQNVIFSDTARVEVLKGPQGTLFGRNAAMGVVNIVPNAPSAEFESFLQASWGTDNLQRYEGMVNVPLSDNFYMRANWITNKQDGFVENVQDAEWNQNKKVWDLGARNHDAARVAFLWDISESTNFQFSFDWDDLDQAPPVAVGLSEYAYGGGQNPFANKASNDVAGGRETRDMYGLIAKLNHDFNDDWSMKYIVSYRDWDTDNIEDSDGTGDRTRYFHTNTAYDSDIFYTELQVNYTSDNVNLVTGFSFSKENVKQKTDLNLTADTVARLTTGELNNVVQGMMAQQLAAQLGGNTDAHAAAAFGEGATFAGVVEQIYTGSGFPLDFMWEPEEWAGALTALGFADDIMAAIGMPGQPLTAEIVQLSGDITYDAVAQALGVPQIFGPSFTGQFWRESINNRGSFTNWGVFADVDFSITDNWNVIAGLRYSNDDKDFSWYIPETNFAAKRPGVTNILFAPINLKTSDSWDKVTGRLVTSYHFSGTDMVFASYSTGYKSGGFDSLSPRVDSFSPEDTTNYEVGYKGILFDKLVANISGYYLELDNFQQTVESKAPGDNQAIPIIVNEDRTIKGIELELRWNVTDNLTLGAVSEYRKTEIQSPEFYNAKTELISAQTTNLDPQTNYTLTLDWMPDLGMGHTNLHIDYAFVENTNKDIPGLEDYKKAVPEYFRDTKNLSARLSWAIEDESLELGLWGKNITDERQVTDVVGLSAGVLGTPFARINRGAEFGFDVKFNF